MKFNILLWERKPTTNKLRRCLIMKKCDLKAIVEMEMDLLEEEENDYGFFDNPDL